MIVSRRDSCSTAPPWISFLLVTGRCSVLHRLSHEALQLALREWALEPCRHLAVLVDPEYPRLGRQVVGEELRPVALRRRSRALEAAGLDLIVEVDLHVDERRPLRPL